MAKEVYRDWLVRLIAPCYVIMVTARAAKYRAAALANIRLKTGWEPQEAYFNDVRLEPHEYKALALTGAIWPAHGQGRAGGYYAIESNARTRRMYARYGVPAKPVPTDGTPWARLPFAQQSHTSQLEMHMDQPTEWTLEPRIAAPNELIVLLDLNYTLVANQLATRRLRPFEKRLEQEAYRQWLVDLVAERFTILVTARPIHQAAQSLANVKSKTGWAPQEAYFSDRDYRVEKPAQFKERVLTTMVWPRYGQERPYFAPESNPRTRAMYARHGILAKPVPEDGSAWEVLPVDG